MHITLLTSAPDDWQNCLVGKSIRLTKEYWTQDAPGWFLKKHMVEHIKILPENHNEKISVSSTSSVYCYGDGKKSKAVRIITASILIVNKNYMIAVDVVPYDIPLLISKKSTKSLGTELNFLNGE